MCHRQGDANDVDGVGGVYEQAGVVIGFGGGESIGALVLLEKGFGSISFHGADRGGVGGIGDDDVEGDFVGVGETFGLQQNAEVSDTPYDGAFSEGDDFDFRHGRGNAGVVAAGEFGKE